jgi:hypothetical protein
MKAAPRAGARSRKRAVAAFVPPRRRFCSAFSRKPCSTAAWVCSFCARPLAPSHRDGFVFARHILPWHRGCDVSSRRGRYFSDVCGRMNAGSPMISVEPSYARKLLRELAVWSQSFGFSPQRDFALVEPIFGDVSADASDAVFQFGSDGRPVYIPGPTDTAPQIRQRMQPLQKALGDDGSGFEPVARS